MNAEEVKRLIKVHCPPVVSFYRRLRQLSRHMRPLHESEIIPTLFAELQATTPEVFFVQIGAMDGVSFDPLYQYVIRYGWRGLLVEPLPDLFEQLKRSYSSHPGMIFENVAIAEKPCSKEMYRVPLDAVEHGLVPIWAKGISSFFNDRNALGGVRIPAESFEQIRPYITTQSVACDTLPHLLERHHVRKIDVFVMDVEGYDYQVLRQLDLERFVPRVIMMEWSNLPDGEKALSLSLLRRHGYHTAQMWEGTVSNLVAWQGRKMWT
jgi:FkbM family methyltransferase